MDTRVVTSSFFNQQKEHSRVKAEIVSSYFARWARIMINELRRHNSNECIEYIDLFAGTGRYEDGNASTPLLILQHAIDNPDIRERLVTTFADKDPSHIVRLRDEINNLKGVDQLRHTPRIECQEVDEKVCQSLLNTPKLTPSLFFLDPCGYKGLTLDLIEVAIRDWGCECIFFFNYNRVNQALTIESVDCHIDALFTKEQAYALRKEVTGKSTEEREELVMKSLFAALRMIHGRFVLPFRVRSSSAARTSHYLVFVTKHFRGFERMRDVMSRHSSTSHQGVPSFEYNPIGAAKEAEEEKHGHLFDLYTPLADLADMLLNEFADQILTMKAVYEKHSPGRLYIEKNYKDALLLLEADGRIITQPAKRRLGTFGPNVVIRFPSNRDT